MLGLAPLSSSPLASDGTFAFPAPITITSSVHRLPLLSAKGRIGSRGNIVLPLISVTATILSRNLSGRASITLSTDIVRLGSRGRSILPLITSKPVLKIANRVVGRASLPLLSTVPRCRGRAILPKISAKGTITYTVATTSLAWVTNLTVEETTKFTNFDFLKVVRIGSSVYGVKSDGLYLIGSFATDNGTTIASYITTHPQNFKQQTFKRIPYMYVQTPYPVSVTSYVDSQTVGAVTTDHGQQKVTLSKGTQGYYWSFKIANVSTNPFKIDGIEPYIDFMKRRA
jgi:hypothetical protein